MNVKEIMTRDVITVSPTASIRQAAQLMADHGVSGLPVVDDEGNVVGILSEGDLIVRQKPRERAPWWRLFFAEGERLARDYQKAVGTIVAEVMTRAVISVSPESPIESVAAILDQHRIRRLPVVADGQLLGIVSRGDLVKALAMGPGPGKAPIPDAELVREMNTRIAREPWVSNRGIMIQAENGVITLWGLVASEAEKSALETMARSIEGCGAVENRLIVKSDLPYHYNI